MKPTAYIETSVVRDLAARPSRDIVVAVHQEMAREWWQSEVDRFDPVASALVVAETGAGDPEAAGARPEALEAVVVLDASHDADRLAQGPVDSGSVPRLAAADAAHIAIAVPTVSMFR